MSDRTPMEMRNLILPRDMPARWSPARRRQARLQDGSQSYCRLTLIIFSEELDHGTRLQHVVGIG